MTDLMLTYVKLVYMYIFQFRTEAFRRRRMEEEMLLAMPIGRINGEALDRAQQIVVRNAKRAEAARLRCSVC